MVYNYIYTNFIVNVYEHILPSHMIHLLFRWFFVTVFRNFHSGQELEIDLVTKGCRGQDNEINYLEHVEVMLDMEYSKRGDLSIYLTSPSGKYRGVLFRCCSFNIPFTVLPELNAITEC